MRGNGHGGTFTAPLPSSATGHGAVRREGRHQDAAGGGPGTGTTEFVRVTDADGKPVILNKAVIVTARSHWRPDGKEAVLIHLVGGSTIEVVADLAEVEKQLRPSLLSQRRGTAG